MIPALLLLLAGFGGQLPGPPPETLPAFATKRLNESLSAAKRHGNHVWRDTPPFNADGTLNGYIEIPRGERRKFEFDMRHHRRAIDRVMPRSLGGYPVNYGFVPQTVSYDGDPFDILVLGPSLPGGSIVRGAIVGLMHMTDEKGVDSKVVTSPVDRKGRPLYTLAGADRQRIGEYFKRYKKHESGKFSEVPGWDTPERGRAFVETTHAFFLQCRDKGAVKCSL